MRPGRPDLAGQERAMAAQLFDSLHRELLGLPPELEIYPGHQAGSACGAGLSGKPASTLAFESVRSQKLRSALAIAGVVIGIVTVVLVATAAPLAPDTSTAIAIVAAAAYAWRVTRPAPLAVVLAVAEPGRVETTVANTRAGSVSACRRAKLATPLGGRIEKLTVREGDRVEIVRPMGGG